MVISKNNFKMLLMLEPAPWPIRGWSEPRHITGINFIHTCPFFSFKIMK
jgi:hypothetical protein